MKFRESEDNAENCTVTNYNSIRHLVLVVSALLCDIMLVNSVVTICKAAHSTVAIVLWQLVIQCTVLRHLARYTVILIKVYTVFLHLVMQVSVLLQLVMQYLYNGGCETLQVEQSDVLELMAAANFFQLNGLLRYCEAQCSSMVDLDNIVSMYIHAKVIEVGSLYWTVYRLTVQLFL